MSKSPNTFGVVFVLDFEFTLDELDRLLACPNDIEARHALKNMMATKQTTDPFTGSINITEVLDKGAKALLLKRQSELKQLSQ